MNKKTLVLLIALVCFSCVVSAGKVDYLVTLETKENNIGSKLINTRLMILNTVTKQDSLILGEAYCYKPNYNSFFIPAGGYVCAELKKVVNSSCYFYGLDSHELFPDPIQRKNIGLIVKEFVEE